MDELEFIWESEMDGIGADAVDDLKGSEVRFGKFLGRSGCLDVFRQEEDLIARNDVGWQNAVIVGRALVALPEHSSSVWRK